MNEIEFVAIVCVIGIVLLLVSTSWEESRERCENLSIQKNASSFIARSLRDCELKFCEEVHSGNDTLLGKCYTEEWELEARE